MSREEILKMSNQESNKITKESIETALIMLMKEKKFEDITITEIIEKAGVSRSGYYRNYKYKEDVLLEIFNKLLEEIMKAIIPILSEDNVDTEKCYEVLFKKVKDNKDLFLIIIQANLEQKFQKTIEEKLTLNLSETERKEKYTILSWSGGTCNVMFEWLKDRMVEKPEELAEICKSIKSNGIESINFGKNYFTKNK